MLLSRYFVQFSLFRDEFDSILAKAKRTSAFYHAQDQKASLVFTTKREDVAVSSDIQIFNTAFYDKPSLQIKYNLQRIQMKAVSLDWMPWLRLRDCDSQVSSINSRKKTDFN